jgi:hypothetical protein
VNFSAVRIECAWLKGTKDDNTAEAQTMTQHHTAHVEPTIRSAFSVPALRRRAAAHPMALFSMVATVAILSVSAPWQVVGLQSAPAQAAPRGADLDERQTPARSEIDLACEGQVWGRETPGCLLAIAKDGGKDIPARIRTISGA